MKTDLSFWSNKLQLTAITKEKLLKAGFDFDFHTHHITSKIKKNEFIFCFDFGYRSLNADTFKIVKAFEYKEE